MHFRGLSRVHVFVKCVRLLGIRTSDVPRLCSGLGMGPHNCRNARNVHVHMETEHINTPLSK